MIWGMTAKTSLVVVIRAPGLVKKGIEKLYSTKYFDTQKKNMALSESLPKLYPNSTLILPQFARILFQMFR